MLIFQSLLIQGSAYPGGVPGFGVGSGDMTGVGGEEKWVDNKNQFEPLEPQVRVSHKKALFPLFTKGSYRTKSIDKCLIAKIL